MSPDFVEKTDSIQVLTTEETANMLDELCGQKPHDMFFSHTYVLWNGETILKVALEIHLGYRYHGNALSA